MARVSLNKPARALFGQLKAGDLVLLGARPGQGKTLMSLELIIDNGDPGTSSTGSWPTSSGLNPYGVNSLYANSSASYTFQAPPLPGARQVSLWWTEFSNRATNVPVDIYDGATLLDTVFVNQQVNGGQWNVLGTYTFTGQARVVIRAGGGTTCADAVRFQAM